MRRDVQGPAVRPAGFAGRAFYRVVERLDSIDDLFVKNAHVPASLFVAGMYLCAQRDGTADSAVVDVLALDEALTSLTLRFFAGVSIDETAPPGIQVAIASLCRRPPHRWRHLCALSSTG